VKLLRWIVGLLLPALLGMGATVGGMALENAKTNARQDSQITAVSKDNERLYQMLDAMDKKLDNVLAEVRK